MRLTITISKKLYIIGGKNYMFKKLIMVSLFTILIIVSTTNVLYAMSIKQQPIKELITETVNRQVDLGSASIIGDGHSSNLEAVAKNDLHIGLGSETGYADFYITYDMNCTGNTDAGLITLIITIGNQIIPKFVTTSTSENGTLKIENVEVHRQDALIFVMYVNYTSIIPLYSNSTSAAGSGFFSKAITIDKELNNQFLDLLEQHPRIFQILRYLRRL